VININRIKQLRSELDLTQEELSKKLGLSKSIIGLYESDTRKPSFEVLEKLSNIFDCSVDYFMGISDIRHIKMQVAATGERNGLSPEEVKLIDDLIEKLKKK
jgi:transcriptional regulator with XRE-family HTH domain